MYEVARTALSGRFAPTNCPRFETFICLGGMSWSDRRLGGKNYERRELGEKIVRDENSKEKLRQTRGTDYERRQKITRRWDPRNRMMEIVCINKVTEKSFRGGKKSSVIETMGIPERHETHPRKKWDICSATAHWSWYPGGMRKKRRLERNAHKIV